MLLTYIILRVSHGKHKTEQDRQLHYKCIIPAQVDFVVMRIWDHFLLGIFSAPWVIYPVSPGNAIYSIGSPIFEEVTLQLGNDKNFVIKTEGNSKENKYIQSGNLNGNDFNRTWISHKEITNGGTLVFKMGPQPNKDWGHENVAPSMTE